MSETTSCRQFLWRKKNCSFSSFCSRQIHRPKCGGRWPFFFLTATNCLQHQSLTAVTTKWGPHVALWQLNHDSAIKYISSKTNQSEVGGALELQQTEDIKNNLMHLLFHYQNHFFILLFIWLCQNPLWSDEVNRWKSGKATDLRPKLLGESLFLTALHCKHTTSHASFGAPCQATGIPSLFFSVILFQSLSPSFPPSLIDQWERRPLN